jgi:superfamily II DNA/RNA helicase
VKFSDLQLHPILQANLDRIQFIDCTPIQDQAIPLLRQGKDISGLAQTGTGKTGAFLIPLIDRLLKAEKPDPSVADSPTVPFNEWKKKQYVLVLVPTRELCEQVQENAKSFLQDTGFHSVSVYGGTTYDKQVAALKGGVEFVVATPGRFIDLYKEHVADLGLVRAIIFDEADRMFDMGFRDDMKFILKRVPRDRQFLVFSATLNFEVLNTAYEYGADPVEINISRDQAKAENVKDFIIHLGHTDKPKYLLSLLKKHNPRQAIIFSNFKHNVERIAKFLSNNGIPAMGISSLLTQAQRNRVMAQFKAENEKNILVATDVAARGLDILGVDMVFNFDLPDDAENYVHRIGRTGRAGQTGQAFSMVGDRDVEALQRIEDYLKHKVEAVWMDDADLIPDFAAFPADESRRHSGPPGRGRGGRDERPPRRDGPPREGRPGGGGRPTSGDRPQRPRREGGGGTPEHGQGPRRESHRDRSSGRHRDQQQQAGSSGAGGQHQPHRRGGNDQRPNRGGHPNGRPQSGNGHPNRGNRPQGGHPRHGQSSRPPGHRPRVTPRNQPPPSLGQKVSGFLKKLFGGKES